MAASSKDRLLEAGLAMLLERGYHDLGIQALLEATALPKGSFYHHFKAKEDFALQVIDRYMVEVHKALDACLDDPARTPMERIRGFFEGTLDSYRQQGYLGCLLGGLGQELSGVSDVFRAKIQWCFAQIAQRLAMCLERARAAGDIPASTDTAHLADLLVNCWEGAALRTRLQRDPAPAQAMLDFFFRAAVR